ncbi:MAG: hypothetical protein J7L53_05595 [Deltaproteobacteria bacterium]|nr:hypothetical protein [Deltaproteobacteria bacterium]
MSTRQIGVRDQFETGETADWDVVLFSSFSVSDRTWGLYENRHKTL